MRASTLLLALIDQPWVCLLPALHYLAAVNPDHHHNNQHDQYDDHDHHYGFDGGDQLDYHTHLALGLLHDC